MKKLTFPDACRVCRGSGSRIAVPVSCPRQLEIWHLRYVECAVCRGTGRFDLSEPSDVALTVEWERGGGYQVPADAR